MRALQAPHLFLLLCSHSCVCTRVFYACRGRVSHTVCVGCVAVGCFAGGFFPDPSSFLFIHFFTVCSRHACNWVSARLHPKDRREYYFGRYGSWPHNPFLLGALTLIVKAWGLGPCIFESRPGLWCRSGTSFNSVHLILVPESPIPLLDVGYEDRERHTIVQLGNLWSGA